MQHEGVRKGLIGKAWNFTVGEEGTEPERVSVTRTCAKALLQCAKQKGGGSQEEEVGLLGVLTNAVFEDKGKEQLLSLESKGEGVLGRVLELAGTSTSTGGSSSTVAGLVQARALRLLVNASSAEALRKSLIPHHAPEAVARLLRAEVAAAEASGWKKGGNEEAVEAVLGLLVNLGLEPTARAVFAAPDSHVLASLETVLRRCTWPASYARAAGAAARVLQENSAATQAVEQGLLLQLAQRVAQAEQGVGGAEAADTAVRGLAVCLKAGGQQAVAAVAKQKGALEALVKAVGWGRAAAVGNAALALQLIGNGEEWLERLGKAGAVPALLAVVHHQRGPAQKNAALALARVVKREESMRELKSLHGLEVLNAYLRL